MIGQFFNFYEILPNVAEKIRAPSTDLDSCLSQLQGGRERARESDKKEAHRRLLRRGRAAHQLEPWLSFGTGLSFQRAAREMLKK